MQTKSPLSDREQFIRANVRNLLFLATLTELRRELDISHERQDYLRARFVRELIEEVDN